MGNGPINAERVCFISKPCDMLGVKLKKIVFYAV